MAQPIKTAEERCSAQIHVLLKPRELAELDTLAARLGLVRSEAVRQALAAFVAEQGGAQ